MKGQRNAELEGELDLMVTLNLKQVDAAAVLARGQASRFSNPVSQLPQ